MRRAGAPTPDIVEDEDCGSGRARCRSHPRRGAHAVTGGRREPRAGGRRARMVRDGFCSPPTSAGSDPADTSCSSPLKARPPPAGSRAQAALRAPPDSGSSNPLAPERGAASFSSSGVLAIAAARHRAGGSGVKTCTWADQRPNGDRAADTYSNRRNPRSRLITLAWLRPDATHHPDGERGSTVPSGDPPLRYCAQIEGCAATWASGFKNRRCGDQPPAEPNRPAPGSPIKAMCRRRDRSGPDRDIGEP
jgi:hypothetical protein